MRTHLIMIITLIWLAVIPCTGSAGSPVRLSLFEFPPFMGRELPESGLEPTIVKAVFALMNQAVSFQFLPPARAMLTAEKGRIDGALGWVWSEDRAEKFHYTDPIITAPLVFFHLKRDPFVWQTWDDLTGRTIGIVFKNYYGPDFHREMDAGRLRTQEVSRESLNFDKLLAGRIDLFPVNLHVGYHMIGKQYPQKTACLFTHSPRPLKISRYHLLLSKAVPGNDRLKTLFNGALNRLRASGEYNRICVQYPVENACVPQGKRM